RGSPGKCRKTSVLTHDTWRREISRSIFVAMHTTDISSWQHTHHFHSANVLGERNTRRVVVLTAVMMVVEITTGWIFHSMALLADGWHMSSHVLALGLTAGAYALSRRYANDTRFAFGTWKIEVLGGIHAFGELHRGRIRCLSESLRPPKSAGFRRM